MKGGISGFFHAGITVRSMDESVKFYRDALDLEVAYDRILDKDYLRAVLNLPMPSIRSVYLNIPGGGFLELLEYQGIERMSAASRPCDYGAGHVCFYVEDVDALFDRVVDRGYLTRSDHPVDITHGPNAGARSAYLVDPDGYLVERFQRAPAA